MLKIRHKGNLSGLGNAVPKSHGLLNKNSAAKCGIPLYELLPREAAEAISCSSSWLPPEIDNRTLLLKMLHTLLIRQRASS